MVGGLSAHTCWTGRRSACTAEKHIFDLIDSIDWQGLQVSIGADAVLTCSDCRRACGGPAGRVCVAWQGGAIIVIRDMQTAN